MRERGDISIETIPLSPLHDVRKIEGTLAELTAPETLKAADPEDYVSVVLTDEEDLFEPGQALVRAYPRLLEWRVENTRTRHEMQNPVCREEKKSVLELFGDFYERMRGVTMNEKQKSVMREIIKAAGGERE